MIQKINPHNISLNIYAKPQFPKSSVVFRGASLPSQYKTSFDYLASEVVGKGKKWGVDSSMLSSQNIREAMSKLFKLNKVFGPYIESNVSKINWKSYIPDDIRTYCVNKINDARAARLKEWQEFLEYPKLKKEDPHFQLVEELKNDPSLKFIIWHSINSELKANNRHIPVPLNVTALDETINHFKDMNPKFRAVMCAAVNFLDMYTHRLRDNLLMSKGIKNETYVWVKIPSIKNDPQNASKNISELEVLSYRNWCTRSSYDKAEAALQDGDFYVYLERDDAKIWHSILGMASSKGKIDQIQGRENNNLIPSTEIENIKNFLKKSGLKCQSGVSDEGPKALQQILIAEKLSQVNQETKKSLAKALKDKDMVSILKSLNYNYQVTPEGNFVLKNYKPQVLLDPVKGITVPFSFIGINENEFLTNVERIEGDMILFNKNPIYNSELSIFPANLKKVTGRVICNKAQFDRFKSEILQVVSSPEAISVH